MFLHGLFATVEAECVFPYLELERHHFNEYWHNRKLLPRSLAPLIQREV